MEFSRVYCVICGSQVPYRYRVNSWQRDFRAVRCDKDSEIDGKPFLTGVGGYVPRHLPNCAAPSDPGTRWDDEGVVLSENDSFPPLIERKTPSQPGFMFHEVCWKVLQGMLYPHPVPIGRFYDMCLSCPASKNGWLDWGHSYGGLMDRLPSAGYPWEDVYVAAFVKRYLGEENSPLIFSKADPLDVPEIRQALMDSRDYRLESKVTDDTAGEIVLRDCFRRLPLEILDYIQRLLPSRSVANVRLASRSFSCLKLGQSFWASRFDHHQERGYCFEATHPLFSNLSERRIRDWKLLYERTGLKRTSSDELRNRKRVWDCLKGLVDLLLEEPLTDPSLTRNLQTLTPLEEFTTASPLAKDWRTVGGDSASRTPAQPPSGMPCRAIYEQVVPITSRVKHLGISFRKFNNERYISAVRFVFDDDNEVVAGYVLPSGETYLDLHSGELTGFIVAVSPRGIKALRAVTGTGLITDWAGCPNDLPQTLRLCMREPIPTLKISVDGLKLVSLSTPTSIPPLFSTTGTDLQSTPTSTRSNKNLQPPHLPLRTTGLWYPTIPSPNMNLHSETFPGRDVSLNEYRPLVHLFFAGPNAVYLRHLTRISVTVSMAAIVGMDFYYDESAPVHFLQACKSTASADDSVKIPFSIDGPGGEVLTGLQGDGDFFLSAAGWQGEYKYGAITSLKVTTNHNRSFIFQPSAIPILKLPAGPYVRQRSKKTVIPSGSTLTGIYFMHDPKFGMVGIGPISEDLNKGATAASRCEGIEDEIRARMKARSRCTTE